MPAASSPQQRIIQRRESLRTEPKSKSPSLSRTESTVISVGRSKSVIVSAACDHCRARKTRCDAVRPACGKCAHKRIRCHYASEAGETRVSAIKSQNALLQRDLDTALQLLHSLRSTPAANAQGVLEQLRSSELLSSLLQSCGESSSPTLQRHASSLETKQSPAPDLLDGRLTVTAQPPKVDHSAQSVERILLPRTPLRDDHECRNAITEGTPLAGLLPGPQTSSPSDTTAHGRVPTASQFSTAIATFFNGSGKLFHVYTEEQAALLHSRVFQIPGAKHDRSALCQLSAIAAVGAYYNRDRSEPDLAELFYHRTKLLLDDALEQEPLQAAKVCVLLSMHHVMKKATVALSYVGESLVFIFHGVNLLPSLQPAMVFSADLRSKTWGLLSPDVLIWNRKLVLRPWPWATSRMARELGGR